MRSVLRIDVEGDSTYSVGGDITRTDMPNEAPRARARLAQQRSRERRRAILDAALQRYLDGGRANVTHRSVAEAAAVPLASVGYYFTSLDELVEEALTTAVERVIAELRELDLSEQPLERVVGVLHDFFMADGDAGRLATWRLVIGAVTMPRAAEAIEQLLDVVLATLSEAFGSDAPEGTAMLALLLLFGQAGVTTGSRRLRPEVNTALRTGIAAVLDGGDAAQRLGRIVDSTA